MIVGDDDDVDEVEYLNKASEKEQYGIKPKKKESLRIRIISNIESFIKNMPDDIIIDIIQLPQGKDVNDLTKEEFDNLEHFDKYNF